MKLCPVILAGGEGTRLWPLSRKNYPKQFLNLFDDYSLLQNTLMRVRGLAKIIDVDATLLICNEAYRFIVEEQATAIDAQVKRIILEPAGRNTAPALTVAALAQEEELVLLMLPADHIIKDVAAFEQTILAGLPIAEAGHIVTFGMHPATAATEYGYIKKGKRYSAAEQQAFAIECFVEKPDVSTATEYCATGDYYWNSGIFMLRASTWLSAMESLAADIYQCSRSALMSGAADQVFYRLDATEFAKCRSDSIDYAVMERLGELPDISAYVIAADVAWADIGAWDKVWEEGSRDEQNNVTTGDVVLTDSQHLLVRAESRMVTAVGCEELVIIETADAVMVMDKQKPQHVKELVKMLEDDGREELDNSTFVHRPWGGYESIQSGIGYQVKRLIVKPGKKISLQLHQQRSEHWVVIKGTAQVLRDEQMYELGVNESIYIELGAKHRLANAGVGDLEVIEVQVGAYLGEDDIVRFDDDFGRA